MSSPERAKPAVLASAPRQKSQLREYAEALFVALLLALAIRTFVVQAFKIPSGSMLPTLQIGDHILVNKFLYGPRLEVPLTQISLGRLPGLRKPRPGDVVVFVYPKNPSQDFIKRVIAVGGQKIEIRNRQIFLDGQPWGPAPSPLSTSTTCLPPEAPFSWPVLDRDDCGPYTVPEDSVFVMGDNRAQSYDSRAWGPVPLANVKGKALIIYWSWDGPDRWVRWDRIGRLVN
jgi:signal peptidase I